ncbi:MAG: hypothetical protein AAFN74_12945 [Myxococcota bacterium]
MTGVSKSKRQIQAPPPPPSQLKGTTTASKSTDASRTSKVTGPKDAVQLAERETSPVADALKSKTRRITSAKLSEANKLNQVPSAGEAIQPSWNPAKSGLDGAPKSPGTKAPVAAKDGSGEAGQIFIYTPQGLKALDFSKDMTGADVKRQLGFTHPDARLKFGGKTIEDDKKLSDANVGKESSLHIQYLLRGGNDDPEPTRNNRGLRNRRGQRNRARAGRNRGLAAQRREQARPAVPPGIPNSDAIARRVDRRMTNFIQEPRAGALQDSIRSYRNDRARGRDSDASLDRLIYNLKWFAKQSAADQATIRDALSPAHRRTLDRYLPGARLYPLATTDLIANDWDTRVALPAPSQQANAAFVDGMRMLTAHGTGRGTKGSSLGNLLGIMLEQRIRPGRDNRANVGSLGGTEPGDSSGPHGPASDTQRNTLAARVLTYNDILNPDQTAANQQDLARALNALGSTHRE